MSTMPKFTPNLEADDSTRMEGLIVALSAYIEQFHGGYVRLISFEDDILTVEMGGACIGCPLSQSTLHGWIEGNVRQFFPDIKRVIGIEAPSS